MSQILKRIVSNELANKSYVTSNMRLGLYRICGMTLENVHIRPDCYFSGFDIKMGEGTYINSRCHFDADRASIEIGRNVSVGMEVVFCTSSHEVASKGKRAGNNIKKPITVDDGCWIGARSVILPGVTIGEGCVIAAGTVINKNCEPNGLYAGVPAKRIKDLLVVV